MYPVLFRIGDSEVTTFGLMMFVSFLAGGWVTSKMLKRYGLNPALIWEFITWIAIAGIVGAKLYFLALHWEQLLANPRQMALSREGRSIGDSIPASISDVTVVPVHATQLYEVAIALVLFLALWRLGKHYLKPGQLFASFMALYAIERFLIEFLRAKGDRFVFGLSTAQAISVVLVVAACRFGGPDRLGSLPVP